MPTCPPKSPPKGTLWPPQPHLTAQLALLQGQDVAKGTEPGLEQHLGLALGGMGTVWGHRRGIRTPWGQWERGHPGERGHHENRVTTWGHQRDTGTFWEHWTLGHAGDTKGTGDILRTLQGHPVDRATMSPPLCGDILGTGRHPGNTRGTGDMGMSWGHNEDKAQGHHVPPNHGDTLGTGPPRPQGEGTRPPGDPDIQAHLLQGLPPIRLHPLGLTTPPLSLKLRL